eukprot:snap_masked-scaffold_9-processed-gene-1.15-mRNA-1 protein AED:1.00 eAED:1.00 QI:0/-1/0/0/-1/1/1/0/186
MELRKEDNRLVIQGSNTYYIKDHLKKIKCKWAPFHKYWFVKFTKSNYAKVISALETEGIKFTNKVRIPSSWKKRRRRPTDEESFNSDITTSDSSVVFIEENASRVPNQTVTANRSGSSTTANPGVGNRRITRSMAKLIAKDNFNITMSASVPFEPEIDFVVEKDIHQVIDEQVKEAEKRGDVIDLT